MAKKVLITSVEAGGGHVTLKDSLLRTLRGHEKKGEIEIVEYNSEQKLYDKLYRIIARSPMLLRMLHYSSIRLVRWFKPLVAAPEEQGAARALKESSPDVVICTHPFQTLTFQRLRRKFHLDFKIASVVADYGDPKEYVEYADPADFYLVRDDFTKNYTLNYVPEEAIFIYGTVVNEPFERYRTAGAKEVAGEFEQFFAGNFPGKQFDTSRKNVLILGGSGWTRKSKSLIEAMSRFGLYNVFVCCGKDKALQAELLNLENVYPFGFVPQTTLAMIERFVDAAVLSSLAPATMYELLTINKYPIFCHRHIARQEAPHVKLLSDWQVGFYQPDDTRMLGLLEDYFNHPTRYRHYVKNAARKCAEEKQKAANNYKIIEEAV